MWQCTKCKIEIEDQFDSCWQCGIERGASSANPDTKPRFEPPPLERKRPCLRCSSEEIVNARLIDHYRGGHRALEAHVSRDPKALLFNDASSSILIACVCRKCGHTEIVAEDPEVLWQAHQDFLEQTKG